jgi:tetratricopeptide (TPR) repeat protein
MEEKTLKQNILATVLWSAATLLLLAVGGAAQTLDQTALTALESGDTATAITRIEASIKTDPTYYYNYHVLGLIAYKREDMRKARDYFTQAVDKKKKSYESLYYLGMSQLSLEDFDGAEKSLSEGLKKAREMNDQFEYGMGLVYLARKNYPEADRSLRRALAKNDKRADYHIALGDVNLAQGVPSLAVSEYEVAYALDTAGTDVFFHWAEACLETKDYNCALDKLRIVLTRDSTFAPAWNRAGGIYFKAALSSRGREERVQRFGEAIGSYKRYMELTGARPDSSTVRAFFEIAMAYTNIYRYEDAIPYFEQVLAIPYEPRDIYFQYGKALAGIKKYDRAAEMLQKHIDWFASLTDKSVSRVDPGELYKTLGDCYFYAQPKRYSEAVTAYKQSLDVDKNQTRVLQNVAVALHTLGRYGEAMRYYDLRIAAGIDSTSAGIVKNASLCALKIAGDESSGIEEELMEEDTAGAAPVTDTFISSAVNYYQVAADYMTKYLEYAPSDTATLERLSNTYLYQLRDCTNGVAACERVLALDPRNCQAKKSIGFAYFMGDICNKDLSKTLRYLLQAHECYSAKGNADVALTKWIAQAYHLRAAAGGPDSNSDFKNAFEWYGKVLKLDPNDAEAKKGRDDTQFEFN